MPIIRDDTYTFYVAKATATCVHDLAYPEKIGTNITVYVGTWQGMSDEGQPAWVEYGPTEFKTAEDAFNMTKYLSRSMWGFDNVRNIIIEKVTRKTFITEDRMPIDIL